MASLTLTKLTPRYPDGTTLELRPGNLGLPGGVPAGTPLQSQVVAGGAVTFTGLSPGNYHIAGFVGGQWLWTTTNVPEDPVFPPEGQGVLGSDLRVIYNSLDARLDGLEAVEFGNWRTLMDGMFAMPDTLGGAAVYMPLRHGGVPLVAGANLGPTQTPFVIRLDPNDYPVAPGRGRLYRLRSEVWCNNVALGTNMSVDLRPVTGIGGGADVLVYTTGGIQIASFHTAPPAQSVQIASSSAADLASDQYIVTLSTAGAPAANSLTQVHFQLQQLVA